MQNKWIVNTKYQDGNKKVLSYLGITGTINILFNLQNFIIVIKIYKIDKNYLKL